nr:hypothetical protein GCM10020092_018230 [Actinoplanes digitatis]
MCDHLRDLRAGAQSLDHAGDRAARARVRHRDGVAGPEHDQVGLAPAELLRDGRGAVGLAVRVVVAAAGERAEHAGSPGRARDDDREPGRDHPPAQPDDRSAPPAEHLFASRAEVRVA